MKAYTRVLNQLNEIAAAKGSKAKAVLLNLYLKDSDFKRIVEMMLNPFKTYGITKFFPAVALEGFEGEDPEKDFYQTMLALQERQITGGEAQCALADLTVKGIPPDLLLRIINKDPKAGFKTSSVNKVYPGLIPEFSYMRCSRPAQVVKTPLNYAAGVIVQLKSDGMFINLDREVECSILTTRQGNPLPIEKFPQIEKASMALKVATQTHGELVVYRDGVLLPREQGNGLINSIIEGGSLAANEQVFLHVWDQIPRKAAVKKGKYEVRYEDRLLDLHEQLPSSMGYIQVIEGRVCYSKEEARAYFKEVLLRGGEGTVEKDQDMFWEDGTSKGQVKNKATIECDLKIVGYREGKGKNAATFGSVLCQSSCSELEVAVSGMSDEIRDYIHAHREELLGTVLHALYNVITQPSPSNAKHSLFLPRIDELRKDKTEADSLEKIKADFQAALENM